MASSPQPTTPAGDLPHNAYAVPAVDLPPTIEELIGFPWVDAVLQIPTQKFGLNWATQTFGEVWQTVMPFLRAVVTKRMRKSKSKPQRWVMVVDYDKSQIKREAQYLYDRFEDKDYLKDFLKPKLPVAPPVVAPSSEDSAVPGDAGDKDATVQPPTPSADGAAATKVASSSTPGSAPSKPPAPKRRRGRPKSAAKRGKAPKHAAHDSDSADTVSESDSESDSETEQPITAAADVESDDSDDGDFDWTYQGPNPDAPRTDAEAEATNGTSNFKIRSRLTNIPIIPLNNCLAVSPYFF